MNWDTIISILIILALILGFWAKITKQTIGELIADIRDKVSGGAEDSIDEVREIAY